MKVPPKRRSNQTTFLREPCVGSREGAGEASVAVRMGGANEQRKDDGSGCRGFQIGRRQYRVHRFGEMQAGPAVSENPCTSARLLSGPWEVFKPPRQVVAGPRREWGKPKPAMYGLKKSDEAVRPARAANKGACAPAESPEERASTKGNPGCQSTCRTQSRGSVPQAAIRIREAAGQTGGSPSSTRGRSRMDKRPRRPFMRPFDQFHGSPGLPTPTPFAVQKPQSLCGPRSGRQYPRGRRPRT